MSAEVLLGKPVADAIKADVALHVAALAAQGKVPTLATIRVDERPEDVAYEKSLEKAAANLGIAMERIVLPSDVEQDELLAIVEQMNSDSAIDGCMLFRPLPRHIDEAAICNAFDPSKDVDGISAASLAFVFTGHGEGFAPATAEACIELLEYYGIPLESRRVAVVGRSLVIGKPVGMMLLDRHATVTFCHSRTADLPDIVRAADVVVCAIGRARFFDAAHFREGQVVLDVGINDDGEGGLCGDVDYNAASSICSAVTPVPRGIGSISTSVLLRHVVMAAEKSQ